VEVGRDPFQRCWWWFAAADCIVQPARGDGIRRGCICTVMPRRALRCVRAFVRA
jgi:hypothetical protein